MEIATAQGQVPSLLWAMLESAPVAIVMVDADGRIVVLNHETEQLFGYTREELLGEPIEKLVPSRAQDAHAGWRAAFCTQPQARRMGEGRELHGLRRDGTEVPVEIALKPVVEGGRLFVVSVIVDISQRKRLERRFELAVESAPTATLMIDPAGRIVLVNREVERLFGYERDELLGQPVEILVPTASRMRHPQQRDGFFARPVQRSMGAGRELFGVRRDGTEVPVEIGLNPIQTEDGVYVLSAIVDISARKGFEAAQRENEMLERRVRERTAELARQADELIRANVALERSNMELMQFAYVASHDLQSPLRAVSGFVQLLQRRRAEQLDDEARAWIQGAVDGAQRMNRLIRDLLEFSRVDTRAHPFSPVAMNEVVDDALALLEASIADADATVTADALPTVAGDRAQLVQLMQNLIGNAVKYRGPAAPRVHVSAATVDGEWRFAVHDNGIGIAPEFHDKIFEVFRRLHSNAAYPGTGIGLAVCRRVAHRHGGRLWVESEPGRGSTFYFTLAPYQQESAP